MPEYDTIAIVGVGLIGGSIGLALRERGLAGQVVGIGRDRSRLEAARQLGAIDRTTTDLADGVGQADLVVVCTPVATVARIVCETAVACPATTLVTDAGSTKEEIVQAAESALPAEGARFVGSHPLAGDHRTGAEHARADLFEERIVVVTPSEQSRPADIARLEAFWSSIGANVLTMSPQVHDEQVAATSHLPHLVAFALAAATPEEFGPLAASGWRDTTRVAGGDPALWQQIFSTNRRQLTMALERFDQQLADMRAALAEGDDDRLRQLLQEAKRIRDALGN